ncbi:Extracellular ligand-binding receptor (fragment) [Paraburkholderia ribeironis]|uniref:Extracellular ligand-binding receptor n=1 Tax=Paraburkholderia ribeironis TaxID=1247936 RepID=A0A1N7S7A8_9BURK
MINMFKLHSLVVAVVGVTLFAASVQFASAEQVVKIGISAPLTGLNAANGKDMETGVRKALEEANAQHIAVLDERTAFGQGAVQEFKKAVQAAGGKIIVTEYTNDKAVEFNA